MTLSNNIQAPVKTKIENYADSLTQSKQQNFFAMLKKRASDFIARDKEMIEFYPEFNGMVFKKSIESRVMVVAYSKRRLKPDFYYSFPDDAKAEQYINDWSSLHIKRVEEAEQEKERQKKLNGMVKEVVSVGDVFASSWGYEQTNVDYYQLIGFKGKQTGLFKQIASHIAEDTGYMSARVLPTVDEFINDEVIEKKININEHYSTKELGARITISSFETAYLKTKDAEGNYSSDYCSWGY